MHKLKIVAILAVLTIAPAAVAAATPASPEGPIQSKIPPPSPPKDVTDKAQVKAMVDAALKHGKGTLAGYTARLVHPLWVGDLIEVRGEEQADGKLRLWAADKNGVLCGEMDLEFA